MSGDGYPMLATHDPRLVAIGEDRAKWFDRSAGLRSSSRCSTASGRRSSAGWSSAGYTVRVYVPYGDQWYGYLMRRLAERPANLAFFLRAMSSSK